MAETKLLRKLYSQSPAFVQDLMASVYGYKKNRYRYGHAKYDHWLKVYKEHLTWSEDQLREFQWESVRETLKHAFATAPYHRERCRELGVTAEDIVDREDIAKLPYVTKDDIRTSGERMLSEDFAPADYESIPTSGSTGQPLTLYCDREAMIRHYAIRWAQCRPGLRRGMRYGNFTGLEIIEPGQTRPPFWRMNYAASQRLYSIFHMSDDSLTHYVKDLNRFRPEYLYGYPSAVFALAEFMERKNLKLTNPLKAVVTSSEQCLDVYREKIESVLETRLLDEYGQAEMGGLIFQCECGKLHENISFSLIEFIPTGDTEDGLPVHELICTSIVNKVWPLIRYQVGDTALIDPNAKCPLGKPGVVIERINGRTAHFLETRDGRRISNISVMAKKCRNMKYCQAVQSKAGEMTLRIVKDTAFTAEDEQQAIKEFRKKIGDEATMTIRVEHADAPLLTKSGKFLMIVSQK